MSGLIEKVKVSIIVPIYKVPEKYLTQCINSLINQSMQDIEIILVDDGSPDDCGKICDKYAAKDNRIVVIHQNNKGLSGARNAGYHNAKGKYIMFLDGDDYLDTDACKISYEAAEQKNAQVVFWNTIVKYPHSFVKSKILDTAERFFDSNGCKYLQTQVLDFNGKIAAVFGKLILTEYLHKHNIEHIEKLKQGAEGIVFNIILFEHANSVYYIDEYLNYYTYNENSISHSHNEENYYLIVKCFDFIKEFISKSENKNELEKMLYNRMLYVIVTTGVTGYFNPTNKEKYKYKVEKFSKFLKEPLVAESLSKASYNGITIQRRILLTCVKLNIYWPFAIVGKIRRIQLSKR